MKGKSRKYQIQDNTEELLPRVLEEKRRRALWSLCERRPLALDKVLKT